MKQYLILLVLITISLCPGNTVYAQRTVKGSANDTVKKGIAESNAIYFQAFAKGDSSIFIDRYTRDCWIMPANADPLCGEDAPLDFFRRWYDQLGIRGGKFMTAEIHPVADDLVTEMGLYQLFDGKGKTTDCGKFLVLWKKTPEGWKMFRDAFSSNRPGKCF